MTDESFVYNGKKKNQSAMRLWPVISFGCSSPMMCSNRGSQVGQTAAFFERAGVPNHAQRNRVGGVCRKG